MQSVTLSIPEICTIENHPAPIASTVDGHLVLEYQCDSPDAAIKTARAVVRELVKFRLDKNVQGTRTGSKILFGFGLRGQELPATWRSRGHSSGGAKPALLGEIQEALKPYTKATYFNSSVNEGVVVEDVPCGLQFEIQDGDLVAKLLKSKKGEWTEIPVNGTTQAVALVRKLQTITADL